MQTLDPKDISLSPTGDVSVSSDYWASRQANAGVRPTSMNDGCNNMSNCSGSTNGGCGNVNYCSGSINRGGCTFYPV